MSKTIHQSAIIFNLNNRLFTNALAGITDEQAKERLSEHNNPLGWIAGHTVWGRYNALIFLGKSVENPYEKWFSSRKPYDSSINYPSIIEIKKEWEKVTLLLQDALKTTSEEHLAADSPIKSPIGDVTNAGTVAFLAQHESYDIGQMALLKKYLTKEAMSYS